MTELKKCKREPGLKKLSRSPFWSCLSSLARTAIRFTLQLTCRRRVEGYLTARTQIRTVNDSLYVRESPAEVVKRLRDVH